VTHSSACAIITGYNESNPEDGKVIGGSTTARKRAVVLLGAGASIEYGAPCTTKLTSNIEAAVVADPWMQHNGSDAAYGKIKTALQSYLTKPSDVNFEHIYHCTHELIYAHAPTRGAVNQYRPLMYPFFDNNTGLSKEAVRQLAQKMVAEIFSQISACCAAGSHDKTPLSNFISMLKTNYVTRMYTTNYDDFILQADNNLYVGFDRTAASPQRFDLNTFWHKQDEDSLFFMHGSVHMAFAHPPAADIGELFWFNDRDEALRHSTFSGSDESRMDGTGFLRSAIVTGLDKLSRLQVRPLSHFYSALAQDLMVADVIFVIGSGLGDIHLNTWLHEARRRHPQPPLFFIDYWSAGFDTYNYATDYKTIEMLHKLRMMFGPYYPGSFNPAAHWTAAADRRCAVWDNGFQAFLKATVDLQQVMRLLGL